MRKNDIVVAEYDYYTLDQARKIFEEERTQKSMETVEIYMSVSAMVVIPVLFVLYWIVFGY